MADASGLTFSVDPLIEEAKRRMRRRRVFMAAAGVVLVGAALALGIERSGVSAGPIDGTARTYLTFRVEGAPGHFLRVFRLSCNPPRGNVPQPVQACAAIAAQPTLLTKPKAAPVCFQDPFFISISGRMNGKPFQTGVGTCWAGMPLVNVLGLGPPPR
jgi:hypothetical protein